MCLPIGVGSGCPGSLQCDRLMTLPAQPHRTATESCPSLLQNSTDLRIKRAKEITHRIYVFVLRVQYSTVQHSTVTHRSNTEPNDTSISYDSLFNDLCVSFFICINEQVLLGSAASHIDSQDRTALYCTLLNDTGKFSPFKYTILASTK